MKSRCANVGRVGEDSWHHVPAVDLHLKTESDGVASVSTDIPQFTSGRAAVLVRAVAKDQAAELRRIIHPAQ